jgi:alpha-galactosidase
MTEAMGEIAAVTVDPARARVYAEGWQSWSATECLRVTDTPSLVTSRESLAIDFQYGHEAPPGVFRGAGLLAVDPGDGGPVSVFGAPGPASRVPVIHAVLRGTSLVVSADGCVVGPRGPDLAGALGEWADSFAAMAGVRRPRAIPPVWCSWYAYGADVTSAGIAGSLAAMDARRLPVDVVQIDDGYEPRPGDWLTPSERFGDLPGLIARITDSGRRAGIWIAPMLVGRSSALYARHPDWVVRSFGSGDPVYAGHVCRDMCTALDLSCPAAAEHLGGVLSTMRGWGISYFKIDFCYAGAYEGARHEGMSGVEAYRHGLRVIRDAIGPDAFLVGCGAPILPSVGLVDAMRVGPDIAATWEPAGAVPEHPSLPSQRNAARNVVARAWQHGRFWVNDPDCLMLRPAVQRRADWASLVERYGGLRASGDGPDQLDDWGLETTRRLLVPSQVDPLR